MATSRTKDVRPRTAILWCYNQFRAHLESGAPAGADGLRPKAAGVSVVTVALVIVTTCAVAWWVSIGWVPAYLALMVLIFVTPEGRRPRASANVSASLSEPVEKSDGDVSPDDRPILRAEAAHLGDQHPHLGTALTAGEEADASAMPPPEDPQPGLPNKSTAKPRRGRGRGRKTAKAAVAAEPAPGAGSVTWIRVGPGQFVRADVHAQTLEPQTSPEEIVAAVLPVLDETPAQQVLPELPAFADDSLVEQPPLDAPETATGEGECVVTPADCATGSVIKEYGITPSAFAPIPPVSPSVESREVAEFEQDTTTLVEISPVVEPDAPAPASTTEPKRPGSPAESRRSGRVLRGIASAIRRADRASLRRPRRTLSKTRPPCRIRNPLNVRLRQTAGRAFGRISHVQRAQRPRSPPYH